MIVLIISFIDLYLGDKIVRTDYRARYCGQYGFRTVSRWRGEIIICRVSSISSYIA